MPLFTERDLRVRTSIRSSLSGKKPAAMLQESCRWTISSDRFDVFLSHSTSDAELVLGVKVILEEQGLSVYVDWVTDPDLDRRNVTVETANRLRQRMKQSRSLIYAHSVNSPNSKWMPWELGFFDGYNGAIAIFPISESPTDSFKGQEFLGLYPYIDSYGSSIFVNRGSAPFETLGRQDKDKNFINLDGWMHNRAGANR